MTEFLSPRPFLDLDDLFSERSARLQWVVPGLVVEGAITSIAARAGTGKSLWGLEMAARLAAGRPVMGVSPGFSRHVLYVDWEMSRSLLRDRLRTLGFDPESTDFQTLKAYFHYWHLPDLSPLDTEEGGSHLIEQVDETNAEVIFFDTLSRAVQGDENAARAYQDLWKHTEMPLRSREVTVVWLDHVGHEATRARGSSAKKDRVDVEWTMSAKNNQLKFKRGKVRLDGMSETVLIDRVTDNGFLHHRMVEGPGDGTVDFEWLEGAAVYLEEMGVPSDAGVNSMQKVLLGSPWAKRKSDIRALVEFRKPPSCGDRGNHTGTSSTEPSEIPAEPPAWNYAATGGNEAGTAAGTAGKQPGSQGSPPRGGTLDPEVSAIIDKEETASAFGVFNSHLCRCGKDVFSYTGGDHEVGPGFPYCEGCGVPELAL